MNNPLMCLGYKHLLTTVNLNACIYPRNLMAYVTSFLRINQYNVLPRRHGYYTGRYIIRMTTYYRSPWWCGHLACNQRAYSTRQSVTNLFFGPHIFSFDWSRLPSSYKTAVTLSWPTRNDRLHRGRNCILITWYTKDGKYRCFLGVTFMFLPWTMHCNFLMMLPWRKQYFVPIAQNL